ncbi:MAG TPA: DUF3592 domain-containing protein [Myxococcaceae bacterium]|jgi:hypothetical protein
MPLFDEEEDAPREVSREAKIAIAGLVGLGLLIVSLVQGVKTGVLLLFSEGAEAKVTAVRIERIPSSEGDIVMYWPTLRFQSPTGQPFLVTAEEPFYDRLVVGEVLPIRYAPSNPADVQSATAWELWGVCVLCGVLGAGAVAFFLLWRKRQMELGVWPAPQP